MIKPDWDSYPWKEGVDKLLNRRNFRAIHKVLFPKLDGKKIGLLFILLLYLMFIFLFKLYV